MVGSTKADFPGKPDEARETGRLVDRKWNSNGSSSSSGTSHRPLSAAPRGVAAAAAAGDEERLHKRRLATATATAATAAATAKNQKKAEAERALAFDLVRRTLLAPVTHISAANGGRPHDPATFASFAKPAQEKVGDVVSGL